MKLRVLNRLSGEQSIADLENGKIVGYTVYHNGRNDAGIPGSSIADFIGFVPTSDKKLYLQDVCSFFKEKSCDIFCSLIQEKGGVVATFEYMDIDDNAKEKYVNLYSTFFN